MYNDDESTAGYIAIGDAVLAKIYNDEEISRESLIEMLNKQARKVNNADARMPILQGQSLLSVSANLTN